MNFAADSFRRSYYPKRILDKLLDFEPACISKLLLKHHITDSFPNRESYYCSMAHSTTAAWGIPVDAQEIGHKVQAYVDTEIIMQAFRLCVNHSSNGGTSLPAVPEEILRMIADYVKGATMRPHSTEWEANISGCLSEFPLEALFSEEEMMETCKELGCDYTTDDGHRDLRNELMNSDEGHVRSEKRLMRFLVYIGLAGNTRECAFAKYNKVLASRTSLSINTKVII